MKVEINIAILMADLSGYTALTEVHGAGTAMMTVERFLEIAEDVMTGRARLLERAGDQLVIVSEDAPDLAYTAIRLLQGCRNESGLPLVHAGLHYGSVLEKGGSFFGSAMNLTARLAAQAGDQLILCSEDFKKQTENCPGLHYSQQKELRLKNLRNPVKTWLLEVPGAAGGGSAYMDPVCRMQADERTGVSSTVNGILYYFCSDECRKLFTAISMSGAAAY